MSGQHQAIDEEVLSFGSLQLFRAERLLVSDGKQVRLGGRAMDILIALVERAGEVVTKRELMALAWPHTFVDESNLRVHIAALRKLLDEGASGDRFIKNIAGRGYLFSAPVTRSRPVRDMPPDVRSLPKLPAGPLRLVGRDETIAEIMAQVQSHRLVTIVGPAGVGKSAVAVAVSEELSHVLARLCFVDLSAIVDPALLPAALAAALDVSVLTHDPMGNLIAFLNDQDALIVIDNCEHVIDAVTAMVESLLRGAAGVSFMATSREPLLASSESIYRLQPLAVPTQAHRLDARTALAFPAIQLFVARATSSFDTFEFGDAEAPAVAEICMRLDGLPLAIELVAARVDLFGIGALNTDLGERLMLTARGNRKAAPRQQSIRAALDWSHDLLSPSEKLIFRRFSCFRGPFTLESATKIVVDAAVSVEEVLDGLTLLTAKSLIGMDTGATKIRYRLLHITRAYAGEKLIESGEAADLARRHAEHFRDLLAGAEQQWETMSRSHWLEAYGYAIDDVRAALDWAFSAAGDLETAAALITASLPFGFQLSLIDEFTRRAERASVLLSLQEPPIAELRLTSVISSLALNVSVDAVAIEALFDRVTRLCERVVPTKYKIEPLLAHVVFFIENGDYNGALTKVLALASRAREEDDPLAILATDRIAAQAHHFAGDYPAARALAERVIRHPAKVIPLVYSQANIDRQVSMRIVIARSLWIEGRVDQARNLMAESMEMAYKTGPLPITFALAMGACPIALWLGDDVAAKRYTGELLAYSRRYTFERWERLGEGYSAVIEHRSADRGDEHHPGLDTSEPVGLMHRMFLATADHTMLDLDLIARAEAGLCGWCNPEMLRLTGEWKLRQGANILEVERCFDAAITGARKQGALSWELRATTSLAELHYKNGQTEPARQILEEILEQFTEGTDSVDVKRASRLMESVSLD